MQICTCPSYLHLLYGVLTIPIDISLTHNKPGSPHYQEGIRGRPQCIGNYSMISETTMDDSPSKGIVCRKNNSTASDGYWRNDTNGVIVDCDNNNRSVNNVHCKKRSGYVTLYSPSHWYLNPPTNFTCCIEELCATIRVLNYLDFNNFFKIQSKYELSTCLHSITCACR